MGEDDLYLPGVIVVSVLLADQALKPLEPPLQRAPRYTIKRSQLLMGIGLDDNSVVFHNNSIKFRTVKPCRATGLPALTAMLDINM